MCRCGHCKHLTPEYKKLGEAVTSDPKLKNAVVIAKVGLLSSVSSPWLGSLQQAFILTFPGADWAVVPKKIQIALQAYMTVNQSTLVCCLLQVNADDHRELGERFGVRGFPTIKYFGRGKPVTAPEECVPPPQRSVMKRVI